SEPDERFIAGIAQLVEQLICNQQVVGSNPTAGSSLAGIGLVCFQIRNERAGAWAAETGDVIVFDGGGVLAVAARGDVAIIARVVAVTSVVERGVGAVD